MQDEREPAFLVCRPHRLTSHSKPPKPPPLFLYQVTSNVMSNECPYIFAPSFMTKESRDNLQSEAQIHKTSRDTPSDVMRGKMFYRNPITAF